MTFTESVNLVNDGIHLVDQLGATVPTPDPTVDGDTVTWPMPADLPDGPYLVTWRVVSSDGHPISGASSFGVGTAAAVPGSATTIGTADTADTATATGCDGAMARGHRSSGRLCRVRTVRRRGRIRAVLRTGDQQRPHPAAPGPRRAPRWRGRGGRRHPRPGPVHGRGLDEPCLGHRAATRDPVDPVRCRDDVAARTLRRTRRARLAAARESSPGRANGSCRPVLSPPR